MIVIVFGLPGSGKSYFASRLAEMLNAEYINSDSLRFQMFSKRTYSKKEKLTVYDKMLTQLKEAVNANKDLVLDATFYKEDIRKKFQDEVTGKGNIAFIEVKADEEVIQKRLSKPRVNSEADVAAYNKIKKQWEPLLEAHLILQSEEDNIGEMLSKAKEYLHLNNDEGANK